MSPLKSVRVCSLLFCMNGSMVPAAPPALAAVPSVEENGNQMCYNTEFLFLILCDLNVLNRGIWI